MFIFVDGCSHYDQANLAKKWDVVYSLGTGVTQSSSANGRFGGGAITFTGLGGTSFDVPLYIQKNYDGVDTIICGFAIKQTATQFTNGGQLLEFVQGNRVQVGLAILPSGQIRAFQGNVDGIILHPTTGVRTVLGTSINAISSNSFDFLEIKIIHATGTGGSIEIKRNGAAFWTLSNINTAPSGVANSSSVVVGGYSAFAGASANVALQAHITDFHLLNTTANGSDALDPVDFIGDHHWKPRFPTADGADTDFTPTGSVNHFDNVNENPPNTTDYNSSAVVTDRDGFVVGTDVTDPANAQVFIAYTMFCQKAGGGSNELKGFIRTATPAYRNGTGFQVPTPWAFKQSFLCSKVGGGPITVADVDACQHGYEKTI